MNTAGEGSWVWKKTGDFSGFRVQTGQELTLQCGRRSACWNQMRESLKESSEGPGLEKRQVQGVAFT